MKILSQHLQVLHDQQKIVTGSLSRPKHLIQPISISSQYLQSTRTIAKEQDNEVTSPQHTMSEASANTTVKALVSLFLFAALVATSFRSSQVRLIDLLID
jgi:hypothetical protein